MSTTYRITVHDARIVERSYDVEVKQGEDPEEVFYEEHDGAMTPIHEQCIRSNWEIVNVEEVSS